METLTDFDFNTYCSIKSLAVKKIVRLRPQKNSDHKIHEQKNANLCAIILLLNFIYDVIDALSFPDSLFETYIQKTKH